MFPLTGTTLLPTGSKSGDGIRQFDHQHLFTHLPTRIKNPVKVRGGKTLAEGLLPRVAHIHATTATRTDLSTLGAAVGTLFLFLLRKPQVTHNILDTPLSVSSPILIYPVPVEPERHLFVERGHTPH